MMCFECAKAGTVREAVGLCHHCSVALCSDHARIVDNPVTAVYPVAKTVVLPKHARVLLCEICKAALGQSHQAESATVL